MEKLRFIFKEMQLIIYRLKDKLFKKFVINKNKRVLPQVKFGRPNEDQEPLLPENEYYQNMIIKPIAR